MLRLFPEPAPFLPPLKTLLIQGPYHPSAPIHLCLSTPLNSKALVLSPSRQALTQSLVEYNDNWINDYSGIGNITRISSQVDIFYPSTPGHLVALLSSLRAHDASINAPINPKTTLDLAPSLIVLHEPSAYFLSESDSSESQCPDLPYSPAFASFVLFDSQLHRLKFPVVRAPPRSAFEADDDRGEAPRPESAALFAQKYFEWIGTFETFPGPSSSTDTPSRTLRVRLQRNGEEADDQNILWECQEIQERGMPGQKASKTFVWS
ncbi:hypothetical protein BJ138DRAFT_1020892 [Hygrophoropsis aurantiaca]|uniref:Uncharacterized protein n=1 Tax=Hygrophoropsis aurantiaca TaxID=72124 RepID=A0ACB7ZQ00_9AGAM|nr:hypothetical protein BJ138DRAFT_1020892 [Hygrophoropsis aurantiaca]